MEKRGRQILAKIARSSKWTRQKTFEINSAHPGRSPCWQHLQEATKKTFSVSVSWQKQINEALFFFSELGSTIICHVWRYYKDLTFANLFMASCSRMNSPVNQTTRFSMVSCLILLRSLLVNILKQLFTSGSAKKQLLKQLFNNINFAFGE